jgi:hypothetical protein
MFGKGNPETGPRWPHLYETATAQEGYFTTSQAAEAGYSPQLLAKHLDPVLREAPGQRLHWMPERWTWVRDGGDGSE